jgi:hypothetical protein
MSAAAASAYSGLDSSLPPSSSRTRRISALSGASSGRGSAADNDDNDDNDDEDWHHIKRGTADEDDPTSKRNTTITAERKSHLSSSSSSFEIGHDDDDNDEYSDDNDNSNHEYDDDDDDDDDDLSDQYTPTLNQHLSGRTTLLRPRTTICRCSILVQTILSIIAILAVIAMIHNGPPAAISNHLRRPNNNDNNKHSGEMITVVAHKAYEALHSSRLEEYDAKLTLYRHQVTGAEFLAYIPDHSSNNEEGKSNKGKGGGGGGGGYDPKPDKVFGVAFRTKPESSTGVPHILEREFIY